MVNNADKLLFYGAEACDIQSPRLAKVAPSHRKVALQFARRVLLWRWERCRWWRSFAAQDGAFERLRETVLIHLRNRHSAELRVVYFARSAAALSL